MTTRQQAEALGYFRTHAVEWRLRAEGQVPQVNVIAQRNNYVVSVVEERAVVNTVLDVGCGTGELVCAIAQRGIRAVGIDFAPEMIDLASAKAAALGANQAMFLCASIFDASVRLTNYSVIAANGFIEYISLAELERFINLARDHLEPGGSLVVGSRNRLFNLRSGNDFTRAEIACGAAERLLEETIALTSAGTVAEAISTCRALDTPALQRDDRPIPRTTQIDVGTRVQFTPAQLVQLVERTGLRAVDIAPVHIHGVVPQFKDRHPDAHVAIAEVLQAQAGLDAFRLIPQSSSFMLHARKAG